MPSLDAKVAEIDERMADLTARFDRAPAGAERVQLLEDFKDLREEALALMSELVGPVH